MGPRQTMMYVKLGGMYGKNIISRRPNSFYACDSVDICITKISINVIVTISGDRFV
jgi:hypothetical protein